MKFKVGQLPASDWRPSSKIAMGNGPPMIYPPDAVMGKGRMYHLGTNDGTWPWCGYSKMSTSSYAPTTVGPLMYPDHWCPDCVNKCFEFHKVKPPEPTDYCQAHPTTSNPPMNEPRSD